MKVLIFTITVGSGHNQVAKSMEEELKARGHEVKVINMLEHKKSIQWTISKLGFPLTHKFPKIADYFFMRYIKKDKSFYYKLVEKVKAETLAQVNDFQPDFIVSSHIGGRDFVQRYNKEFIKPVISYFFITDYDVPSGVKDPMSDEYIVVPNKDIKIRLSKKQFKEKHILPYGIPIRNKFYMPISKQDALNKLNLNLNPNKKTILILGGGHGEGQLFGNVKELAKYKEFQIICITGKNEKLKNKLEKYAQNYHKNIIVIGWTDQIEYFMSVSDYVVGKTGGLSSTEAIAVGLPMVVMNRIPRVELSNLEYFLANNMAAYVKNKKMARQVILDMDTALMKKNYKDFLCPYTTKNVVGHMENVASEIKNKQTEE